MMSNFASARGALAPLAMSVATAAFLMAGTIVAPSFAQAADQNPPPAAAAPHGKSTAAKAATSMHPGSVEERITQLHNQLKITPNEEQAWKAVAEAMRSNAEDMQKLIEQVRTETPKAKRTALEDLQTYQKFAQAHADGLQKLTTAFSTLYNAMPADQKANADEVFRSFEHRRPNARPHS